MEARDRSLESWFDRIESGQIQLPRFQRHEAWGYGEVGGLLESVLRGLPSGAALILEVGHEPPFIARPLVGAPEPSERTTEHLLDGQQRLTALWRALHDDYPDRVYLIGTELDDDGEPQVVVQGQRVHVRNGTRRPQWLTDPRGCWERGWIPATLLRPGDLGAEVRDWARAATDGGDDAWELSDRIIAYRERIKSFNIPFLGLPINTPRETALDVFIRMNTSSIKLSSFDIIVAQVEAETGESLHDLLAGLHQAVPRLTDYRDPEDSVLDVACLRENRSPSQASYLRLDLAQIPESFDEIIAGLKFTTEFLEHEGVFDGRRLPSVAVIGVIASLAHLVPPGGDERGNATSLLRSYLWRAFATSRYDRAAATSALQDRRGLESALTGGSNSAPIFDPELYPLPDAAELRRAGWPKNRETLARAIMCASLRAGAFDLADGAKATPANLHDREYHHLYPDAFLKANTELESSQIYRALNCALITWVTNRRIGAKQPLVYLRERIDKSDLGEAVVRQRLESHLIPWDEFAVVDADASDAYDGFLDARAELVSSYITQLASGAEPTL